MKVESCCPPNVRSLSAKNRAQYFKADVIVDHPSLSKALDSVDERASPLFERRLILLVGPTAGGKSALMRKLVERRLKRGAEAMRAHPYLVPAFLIEVGAPDRGPFKFTTLCRGSLLAMQAALPDCASVPDLSSPVSVAEARLLRLGALRLSIEEALRERLMINLVERRVEVACLDEAVNIFKVGHSKSREHRLEQLKNQADKLKTFTNQTLCTAVLAGAYDFLDLTLSSAQLARRSLIIHLAAYDATEAGLAGFTTALIGLISFLPCDHELDPEKHALELFLRSLGCVGLLKNIMTEGLSFALQADKPLTIDYLRAAYYPAKQLEVMRSEMMKGAKTVEEMTALADLADRASEPESAGVGSTKGRARPPLKPGETKPSHRHEATEAW